MTADSRCPIAYDHDPDLPDGCAVCGWPHGRRIGPMGEDLGPAEPPDPGRALVEADPETLTGLERVRRAILIARGTYAVPTAPVLFASEKGRAVIASDQGHPPHLVMAGPTFTQPAQPVHLHGLLGWKVRRACRKRGGHWWHPADPMIAWFCCQCGAERDGMPKDGT